MDLQRLVEHVAEAIPVIDAAVQREGFLPGVGTMGEDGFRDAVKAYLDQHYSDVYGKVQVSQPYPDLPRARCDLCICPPGDAPKSDWAIELKKVAFVGDNGKNNDFGPSKVVSPYKIHRSSVLDAQRLQSHCPAAHGAVLMYGFDFDQEVIELGRAICLELGIRVDRIDALTDVLARNGGDYLVEPTFKMFEQMPQQVHFQLGPRAQAPFGPLHRHPIYLKGQVAAWEILEP